MFSHGKAVVMKKKVVKYFLRGNVDVIENHCTLTDSSLAVGLGVTIVYGYIVLFLRYFKQ